MVCLNVCWVDVLNKSVNVAKISYSVIKGWDRKLAPNLKIKPKVVIY